MKRSFGSTLTEKFEPHELKGFIKSYDVIGDIAVIRVSQDLKRESQTIAETILQTHKHVKTILRQVSAISGDYRLRRLGWIAGEKKTETVYKESGCVFKVNLTLCYFSPRLSFERMRIARLIQPKETIVNMFAGVGAFSILIAKYGGAETVYSIDVNPSAVKFMKENIRLNKAQSRVVPILGDAKDVVVEHLQNKIDRVIMPLPEKAYQYLDYAIIALKPTGGWIHYYDFEHASKKENPLEKVKARVSDKLQTLGVDFVVTFRRVVRHTGPNWYQVVLDIHVRCK